MNLRRSPRLLRTQAAVATTNAETSDARPYSTNNVVSMKKRKHFKSTTTTTATSTTANNRLKKKKKIPLDSLNDDILELIYCFLDNPKDVYNLSICNKKLSSILTYKHVIRSSVFAGGYPRKSMRAIIDAVTSETIFVPSLPRMLRLVRGRTCERGANCWGYNMTTGKAETTAKVRDGIGLFLCQQCISNELNRPPPLPQDILSFVAHTGRTKRNAGRNDESIGRLVRDVLIEDKTGDTIGPRLSLKDIKQLIHTTPLNFPCCSTYKQVQAAKKQLLLDLYEERKNSDKHLSIADNLLKIYKEAEDDYIPWLDKLKDKERIKEKERGARRIEKLLKVHEMLISLTQGCEWQMVITKSEWCFTHSMPSLCKPTYQHAAVDYLMQSIITAPSSGTLKRMKQLVPQMKDFFQALKDVDFFSFESYLPPGQDRYEEILQNYAIEHLDPKTMFDTSTFQGDLNFYLGAYYWNIHGFLNDIRERRLVKAFYSLIGIHGLTLNIHRTLLAPAFAQDVDTTSNIPGVGEENFIVLAETIWNMNHKFVSRQSFLNLSVENCRKYYIAKDRVREYILSPLVQIFLQFEEDNLSRIDAIRTIFTNMSDLMILLTDYNYFYGDPRTPTWIERIFERHYNFFLFPPQG